MEQDWTALVLAADVPEGRPVRAVLGEDELLVYRRGEDVFVADGRCTHQGAPLFRGRVAGVGTQLAVTCPAHGSVFRLLDGRVLRGPAVRPLRSFEARIEGGRVEVRRPPA